MAPSSPAAIRALRSVRSRGARTTWQIAKRESRSELIYQWRHLSAWWFDRRMGVDTRAPFRHQQLGVPGTAYEDAVTYGAAPPGALRRLVRRLEIDPAGFTFVDVGSGRGRLLFAAAELGFRRVIGVELSKDLCEAAARNLATYRGPRAAVELQCLDATELEFPDGPLLCFLFNPFGDRTMSRFAVNLDRSLRAKPRPAFVIYHRAWHRRHFEMASTLTTVQEGLDWAIYATPQVRLP